MASGQPDYTRQVAVTVIDTPDPITVIADITSPPLNVTFPSSQNVAVTSMPTSSGVQIKGQDAALTTTPSLPYIAGRTYGYEDTSFVTGDSPVTLTVNTNLGRNAHDGYIVNDGAGNFTVQFSDDGTNYGSSHTMKTDETMKLTHLDINKIKITWVADSAYRVFVV